MPLIEAEKQILVEQMHLACRKVRLAIAVLEADVPVEESTETRLDEALALITDTRRELTEARNRD